LTKLQAR